MSEGQATLLLLLFLEPLTSSRLTFKFSHLETFNSRCVSDLALFSMTVTRYPRLDNL